MAQIRRVADEENITLTVLQGRIAAILEDARNPAFKVAQDRLARSRRELLESLDDLARLLTSMANAYQATDVQSVAAFLVDQAPPTAQRGDITTTEIDAYVDTENHPLADEVLAAIDSLLEALGFDEIRTIDTIYGSVFRRSQARMPGGRRAVALRLQSLERAIELSQVDSRQAEVDERVSSALQTVLSSLESIPHACIRIGSLLIIKYSGPSGAVVQARQLTQPEIWAIERYPELQKNPERVLEGLALALTAHRDTAPDSDRSPGPPSTSPPS